MANKDQSLIWKADFSCGCPQELVIIVKDSALLATPGKYIRAKLLSQSGAVLQIRYDDAVLAVPANGIAACDVDDICCMSGCDLYLESQINALEA